MAVTLSCGDNGALGPPISVLTQPGLTKTQVMPRGAKSIAALRIFHIHGRLGAAIGDGAARSIVDERRAHTTRDGDHQPSLTPGNVIAKRLEHPQGTHRVHVEDVSPGFVVDIAGLLSQHTGDPRAVDEHVYGDILELRCGIFDAFGIGHIHCGDLEHAFCDFRLQRPQVKKASSEAIPSHFYLRVYDPK